MLDDWDAPLDAYVRALAFRLAGLAPDSPIEVAITAAKACSFILNLLCLPALYGFARRRFDARVALGAMAALAMLPVHAIYAGFVLRESLVALTSILAVWTLTEVWTLRTGRKAVWVWAVVAGLLGGLAVMSRTTGLALLAGAGLFGLVAHGRTAILPLWWSGASLRCAVACPGPGRPGWRTDHLFIRSPSISNSIFHGPSIITKGQHGRRRSSTRGRICPRSCA